MVARKVYIVHNGILDLFHLLMHISRNVFGRQITVNRKSLDWSLVYSEWQRAKRCSCKGKKKRIQFSPDEVNKAGWTFAYCNLENYLACTMSVMIANMIELSDI